MNYLLILPNQLFEIKHINKIKPNKIIIIEDSLYFKDSKRIKNFNKLKLVLHRASMKYYYDYLKKNKYDVSYVNYTNKYKSLKNKKVTVFDPVDHMLVERLKKQIKNLTILETPLFLLTNDQINGYKEKKKSKNYFHSSFYQWQLKTLDIPYISKSYDTQNRNPLKKTIKIPNKQESINDNSSKYVKEAIKYVNKNFKNNYGNTDNFYFPITHKTAIKWLNYFLKNKLANFGTYQDAICKDQPFMFHSLLSALINIGLLTPKYVLDKTIKFYEANKKKVKINNFEGFIRQLIGWREYMRMVYILDYKDLIKSNHFGNKNKLSKKWYQGKTKIDPIDVTIKRAFRYGYLHHIERLMVMMNFMILSKVNPHDIYKWFMEFSCDSYDWVMVGNVYGMGYFSTKMMRKPYLSTSNYILKMSDYKKDTWSKVWDALFYSFLFTNKKKLISGAAFYKNNLRHFEKKSKKDRDEILKIAKKYISYVK